MSDLTAILLSFGWMVSAPPPQSVEPFERYLKSVPDPSPHSVAVGFKLKYTSARTGKQREPTHDEGRFVVSSSELGVISVGTNIEGHGVQLGEVPVSNGMNWFSELSKPTRMAPFIRSKPFFLALVHHLPLKAIEPVSPANGSPGDEILVFRLDAPRPDAKFWKFESKAGEARVHVRKDGSVVSLRIVQAYAGRLNPHFGLYSLRRTEEWTFGAGENGMEASRYRIHLTRQDWKESFTAEADLVREERP